MQWVGIDKVKKADGTTLEMGDALVSLSTGTILDGAVTNAKLASTAVTESKTVAGTFTTASLNAGAGILGSQLANTTVTGAQIANSTITNGKLAANAVTESVTLAGTFTTASLNASANIAGTQLASNAAIAGSQLASNTIADSNIATGAITNASINASAAIAATKLGIGITKVLTGTITSSATTGAITGMTIPANSIVKDVWTVCGTTFVADSYTISIGDSGTAAGFIPLLTAPTAGLNQTTTSDANIIGMDTSQRGTLLYDATKKSLQKFYQSGNGVYATITKTNASAGSLTVYCSYMEVA